MYKGIFWLITDRLGEKQLICVKVSCDANGTPLDTVSFSSKSGETPNLKRILYLRFVMCHDLILRQRPALVQSRALIF